MPHSDSHRHLERQHDDSQRLHERHHEESHRHRHLTDTHRLAAENHRHLEDSHRVTADSHSQHSDSVSQLHCDRQLSSSAGHHSENHRLSRDDHVNASADQSARTVDCLMPQLEPSNCRINAEFQGTRERNGDDNGEIGGYGDTGGGNMEIKTEVHTTSASSQGNFAKKIFFC